VAIIRTASVRPTQPGHPLWIGAMSTGCNFGHRWGRNGESRLAVGSATCSSELVVLVWAGHPDDKDCMLA